MIEGSEKRNVSWLLNFRIHMFVKSAVMVSSLILLRSFRVHILKQIVNSGFGNIYLASFLAR